MVVQNGFGLLFAVLLAGRTWGARVYRAIFFMPVVLSLVIVGFLWELFLNPIWGPLNKLLALAGLGACLLSLQYDVHPFIGNTFGPLIFMICVLGGLGNMIGGFIAAFIIRQIIAIGGYYFSTELSYVLAFTLFILLMFIRPQGIIGR